MITTPTRSEIVHTDVENRELRIQITEFIENPSSDPATASFMPSAVNLHKTIYQFGSHASCTVTRWRAGEETPSNHDLRSLEFQVVDEYSFQFELFAGIKRVSGTNDEWRWELSAYKHPFRPPTEFVAALADEKVHDWQSVVADIELQRACWRLLELVQDHPTLLFNPHDWGAHDHHSGSARHRGFVHAMEYLLHGILPEDFA